MLNSTSSVISGGRSTDRRGGIMTLRARKAIGLGMKGGRGAEWNKGRRPLNIDSAMTITLRCEGMEGWEVEGWLL